MLDFLNPYKRKIFQVLLAVLCIAGAYWSYVVMGQEGYALDWGGRMFRALSGGILGLMFSKFVLGLNLSDIVAPDRPVSAISQALLVAGFAIAVS
jgi:hypothetical protein